MDDLLFIAIKICDSFFKLEICVSNVEICVNFLFACINKWMIFCDILTRKKYFEVEIYLNIFICMC